MDLIKQFLKEFKLSKQYDHNNQYYSHDLSEDKDEILHYGEFSHFEVIVHTKDEVLIPHFHLVNLITGDETYIKILVPEYCEHNKDKNTILTNKEINNLVQWLGSPDEYLPKITHFENIIINWNVDYPENQFEYDLKIPDYSLLKN